MYIQLVEGKNNKNFGLIRGLKTRTDFELYEEVKKIVSRSEFLPYIQSINKTQFYSYLFKEYFFPISFIFDVQKVIKDLTGKNIVIKNKSLLVKNNISRVEFDNWISTLKFPEKYDTKSDEYKFQRDSVYRILKLGIGNLDISMSGGKTFITYLFCRYIKDHNLLPENSSKKLVVTPSVTLVKQLKKDFAEYDEFFEDKIIVESMFSGYKKVDNADVVVGTFNSLREYDKEYFDSFGAFICDEAHRSKAYSIRNRIFAKLFNCEYYLGMTGTKPKYKTLDYLHITSMFGPTIVKVTTRELIDAGLATEIKVYQISINYKDKGLKNLARQLLEDEIKGTEKYLEEKHVLQTYLPRTEVAAKLLKHYNENSLIIVNTVEYCMTLERELKKINPNINYHIIHGKVNKREDILDFVKMNPTNNCIIATTKTMSTGVSIPNLTNCYLMDGGKSENDVPQIFGRLMRLFDNKNFGRVFDFRDEIPGSSFLSHAKIRLKIYKERELIIKQISVTI